jgi:hypothetical protein
MRIENLSAGLQLSLKLSYVRSERQINSTWLTKEIQYRVRENQALVVWCRSCEQALAIAGKCPPRMEPMRKRDQLLEPSLFEPTVSRRLANGVH